MEFWLTHRAFNPKITGSTPVPATKNSFVMKQSPSELAKVLLLLSRLKDTGWLLGVEECIGMNLVDRRQVPKVRVRVPLHYFLLWGMGLLGVVACLASRKFRWVQFPQGPFVSKGSDYPVDTG